MEHHVRGVGDSRGHAQQEERSERAAVVQREGHRLRAQCSEPSALDCLAEPPDKSGAGVLAAVLYKSGEGLGPIIEKGSAIAGIVHAENGDCIGRDRAQQRELGIDIHLAGSRGIPPACISPIEINDTCCDSEQEDGRHCDEGDQGFLVHCCAL